MAACVFCRIVSGDQPVKKLRFWGDSVSFEPIDPVTPGHTIVIPKVHVTDALEDPEITGMVFQRAAELADLAVPMPEGFNLITSVGLAATQSVFHLHIHVVPRNPGDGLALPWTGQIRSNEEAHDG
jgi:histidine triad (HIT) family protein